MLAHLKDFNLASLQFYILHAHLLLRHDLDGHLLSCLLVNASLHQAELALAKCFLNLVKVEQAAISDDLLYSIDPVVLVCLVAKVVGADFVLWEY